MALDGIPAGRRDQCLVPKDIDTNVKSLHPTLRQVPPRNPLFSIQAV